MTGEQLAEEIRNVRFTPVRRRQGYDMGEVDALLDELESAALAGEPLAPRIDAVHLVRVRLREGYDIDDVDAFLARLAGRGPAPTEATARVDVIEEKPGLLERLFGRKRGGTW